MNAYLMKASEYYGRRTPGWVAVCHGNPWHFFGNTGKKDARAAIARATGGVQHDGSQ